MPYLNKQSMDELALDSIMDVLFPAEKIVTSKISDETQRKLLVDTIKRYSKYLDGKAKCQSCKDSLAKTGVVCSAHFHDYAECSNDWCLTCFLLHSARAAYPDDPRWWE